MAARKRVLFVCIGNCVRSQMAEAFARAYGGDVIKAESAGLAPAGFVSRDAERILLERGISMDGQYSKAIHETSDPPFDLLVNIAGDALPMIIQQSIARDARDWRVADPMGKKEADYRQAAEQIENYSAERNPATAHLFIVNPLTHHGVDNLFSTHPAVENRIAALEQLAMEMGQGGFRSAAPAYPGRAAGPCGPT